MHSWIKEYMKLFFENREESYQLKHQNIPRKLYKYQPISDSNREDRLNALKDNKIWMTKAPYLNDPFDCQPTFYNETELRQFILNEGIHEKVGKTVDYLIEATDQSLKMFRNNMKVSCFSETNVNMPLWGNYADNHKGICIEYDFSQLDAKNNFIKMLYPVGYDEKRYDITNILKSVISDEYTSNPYVLFFLVMMKHNSWKYEQEWRIIDFDFEETSGKGSLIECPVKPTAIYFGLNCSEKDINKISSIVNPQEIKLKKLELKNNEYFHLNVL
ncbi:DUF2971 domain-containing protein [Fictibacillus phosphorivorans]|uniref:DUF2971 domain-containing protein n=1 Tax=Fictibacillus phosphorivorans TaxID=1221500 RepID=UPI00203E9AEC|nr:DUF2971 domain-containing protein [Fictibacillus phosphorivorans]MCM3718098.1 DUF2971 domain-containing protein [Fictibacillus phosphorivorans]MCM3775725.1 DUF2971 domain-containing protein [Fictibacillus phosphorivorans]